MSSTVPELSSRNAKKYLLLVFMLVSTVQINYAQRDQILEIQIPDTYTYQDPMIVSLSDHGDFLTLSQGHANPSARPHNILHVARYDSCGLQSSARLSLDPLFGLRDMQLLEIHNDSLIIYGRAQSQFDHPYTEGYIIRLHIKDFGLDYTHYRMEQGLYLRSLVRKTDGTLAGLFIESVADRPLRFIVAAMQGYTITSSYDFNVGNYTVSGGLLATPDNGVVVITDEEIWRLNADFDMLWRKDIQGSAYISPRAYNNESFIALSGSRRKPRLLQIMQLDFNGNVLQRSEDLALSIEESLIIRFKIFGDQIAIVTTPYTGTGVTFPSTVRILNTSGEIQHQYSLNADPLETNSFLNDFTMAGDLFYWVTPNRNKHGITVGQVDISDPYCAMETEVVSEPLEPLFTLADNDIRQSQPKTITQRSWAASALIEDYNTEVVCQEPYAIVDYWPEDTITCAEKAIVLDLDIIPYEGTEWSDFYPDRQRRITESGIYGYDYTLCDTLISESIYVEVRTCRCDPYIPNSFTPNGDQLNDVWSIHGSCEFISDFELHLFNRWGGLLFTTTDFNFIWDGTIQNKLVDEGVYLYTISYIDRSSGENVEHAYGGDLTILR